MEATSVLNAGRLKTALVYAAMIGVTLLAFLWIRSIGMGVEAPEASAPVNLGAGAKGAHSGTLLHVLLALAVVTAAARVLGAMFRKIHQPPVIGEVLAGILLGPSLLGHFAPGAQAFLFPASILPAIGVLAQVGVLLYMFLVGLELDTTLLRKKGHATLVISHASILAPFVLGAVVALWVYPKLSSREVPFELFAMFMGVALSVTAFPVLARILTDRGMQKTPLGVLAISCAAVDDVSAWCLLAAVVSVAESQTGSLLVTVGLTAAYIAFMLLAVRPAVHWYVRRYEATSPIGHGAAAIVFMGILLSSLATESIGIHAVFGAFILGAVIPHGSLLAKDFQQKLEDLVLVLLLPAFFAVTGLRTELGLLSSLEMWLMCGVILLVACAGKIGGTVAAARFSGLGWRESASLGVLMNTRGLMGLIVLNVGLDLGVISPTLFAMMVIMALATTFMASPLLHWLRERDTAPAVGDSIAA
jgi:Kef-type K+ transport system membrane component KefB